MESTTSKDDAEAILLLYCSANLDSQSRCFEYSKKDIKFYIMEDQ